MYGLSKTADIDFLSGRELIQVVVGLYQVTLNFDGDFSISIESEFDHLVGDSSQLSTRSLPIAATSLLRLLGSKVILTRNLGEGEIHLDFGQKGTVRLFDANRNTESYEIHGPGVDIIV